MKVSLADPEHCPLCALFMARILAGTHAPFRDGLVVLFEIDGVEATLAFADGEARIFPGKEGRPQARVAGSMAALLSVATGGSFIRAILGGRVRARGKVWRLLPLLSLFQGR